MGMRVKSGSCFGILLIIVFVLTSSLAFSSPRSAVRLLYKAIEAGDLDKAKLLLVGTDVNCQNSLGYTPLYKAVFYNRLNFVEYLFELGAKVNLGDGENVILDGTIPLNANWETSGGTYIAEVDMNDISKRAGIKVEDIYGCN